MSQGNEKLGIDRIAALMEVIKKRLFLYLKVIGT